MSCFGLWIRWTNWTIVKIRSGTRHAQSLAAIRRLGDHTDLFVQAPNNERGQPNRADGFRLANQRIVAGTFNEQRSRLWTAIDPHLYRAWLDTAGMHNSATLEGCDDGQRVRVAGLCVVHQAPPTAKGFHFLTLEDEWGMINAIVSPGLVVRDGRHLHGGRVLIVQGVAQREAEVLNVIAQRVEPIAIM